VARLQISLLGPFQVTLDGEPVTSFESNKVRALLTFLAVEAERPHPRETLAGLLWPDYPNRSALSNLRSALPNLRQTIDDRHADPPFLLISRNTIQFNAASDYTLDVDALQELPQLSIGQLEQALANYRGSFLEGFSLPDSAPFEDWILFQREHFQRLVSTALGQLAAGYEASRDYERALHHARRRLALEPWDEDAHRQIMRLLALSGQRSAAIAQYETCRQVLRRELAVEPAQETLALVERIRTETLAPALLGDHKQGQERPAPGEPPFMGLNFFDEQDADLFFGRDALTAQLVAQVQGCLGLDCDCRVLAVIGASGSGKSSIVRAGMLPAIRHLASPADGSEPRPIFGDAIYVITPTARPLEALALALTRTEASVGMTAELLDDLARDPRSLHLAAMRLVHPGSSVSQAQDYTTNLLLVVDQFEELFSLCHDEGERKAFVDNLLYAAETPGPSVVVIALRADFYAQCAPFANLREALSARQQFIGAMSDEELRLAIEEPAHHGDWVFEPGLVDLLLHEVGDAPGALPLLSHALLETWHRRQGRMLTLGGYQEAGGVTGAIANTAERIFKQMTPAQQVIARNIFLRLTELVGSINDEDVPEFYTRRRVALSELLGDPEDAPAVQTVLGQLADARLITTGYDSVEVAHEALIREWSRLRDWLYENRAGLHLHRHLTEATQEWEQLEYDPGGLYRGARLAQAQVWFEDHPDELNALERRFLTASIAEVRAEEEAEAVRQQRELATAQNLAEAERRRAEAEMQRAETQAQAAGKLRRTAYSLAIAAGALILLLVVALWLGQLANRNAQARQEQAQLASSRELAAAAVNNLQVDPERSVLLSLQALSTADTLEARNALHQALPALHIVRTISAHESGGSPGVAYHPDGSRFASIGVDNTVKIWDAESGDLLRTLSGDAGDLGFDVGFSPDGGLLAASFANQVLVWDAASGERRWRLPGKVLGAAQVDRIDFTSDGTRLAVANMDGQAKVWDMTSGREIFELTGCSDHCEAIAFSPDGKRLATGDVTGIVKLWDAATGQELMTLEHSGMIHGIAFSPDGLQLATAGEDGSLVVWDIANQRLLLSLPSRSGLYDVAYLPDGKRLVTVHQDGTTAIWDADTGQPLLTLAGHLSTVISVAASPDNIHIATSGYDSTVRLWDTRPGRELVTLAAYAGPVNEVAYSPDGSHLAAVSSDGAANLLDPSSGLLMLSLFPESEDSGLSKNGIAFSPNGHLVAVGSGDGTVLVADTITGQTKQTLTGHTDIVWGLAFSPDGARLATTSWDGTARVWDLETGKEIVIFDGHQGQMVFGVAFSHDGKRVFTAGDRYGREWDATTGEELRTFSGEELEVMGLTLSPDGQRLALGRQDGTVTVWEVSSGEKLLQLTGHGGLVLRLAFSEDGARLVTASFDKFAKVWDAQTGQELMTLYGNAGNVFGVALSPDGKHAATAGGDGTVRIYTLDTSDLTALAQTRLTRNMTVEECRRYLHTEKCPDPQSTDVP